MATAEYLKNLSRKVKIDSEHPEYTRMKDKWCLVEEAENSCYQKHVIPPEYEANKIKTSRVLQRNANYIARAIYTNYTYGTMSALVGLATKKYPLVELPPALEYLEFDMTEDRLPLAQFTRKALRNLSGYARFIMLTDFPSIEKGLSAEQVKKIDPKPRIRYYKAKDMPNWDVGYRNGAYQLTLAVFKEEVKVRTDGFAWACDIQYRVCELDDEGRYMVTIRDKGGNLISEPMWPQFDGQYLDYIPIDVCGAEDNNAEVDEPPMWPIAHINFGHLRNSANYEDNLDAHGQGTLFVTSDLTTSQWQELTAKKPVVMGSREAYFLGKQGTATLCQLGANQEVAAAMRHKEEQMLALGAHQITNANANAPVATTELNMGSKMSPLVNWVKNFEQALYNQLVNCARYLKVDESSINVAFSTDFLPKTADAKVLQALLAQQMGGIISKKIIRDYDRQIGVIPEGVTDEDIDEEITEENPLGLPTLPTDNPSNPDSSSGNSTDGGFTEEDQDAQEENN